jgi:predicted O-methyltransferase YrrM
MPAVWDEPEAPELVRRAVEAAAAAGFEFSCLPATGRLLAALAAAKPGGRLAESGTGHGSAISSAVTAAHPG